MAGLSDFWSHNDKEKIGRDQSLHATNVQITLKRASTLLIMHKSVINANALLSQAIRIGRLDRTDICHITLNGCATCFVNELKYLGWYVIFAKCFKVSLHHMRVKFFQSFNSIYAKSSHFTERVIQHLVNINCKPHLLFGSEVIAWNNS